MLKILFIILLFSFQLVNAVDVEQSSNQEIEESSSENADEEAFIHNKHYAKVQILNKITAKTSYLDIKVGSEKIWGLIKIQVQTCWKSSPYELSENKILLDISEKKVGREEYSKIFTGWMFSSSPAISTMEHPIYDVVAINCYD